LKEILVLAEHRRGEIRDITFEMLTKARELSRKNEIGVSALLLGSEVSEFAKKLVDYAPSVLIIDDLRLENFSRNLSKSIIPTTF
jgi:electron transfer flavoprotein alpha subunit